MKEIKQDTKTQQSSETQREEHKNESNLKVLPSFRERQGFKPLKKAENHEKELAKFYLADSTGTDSQTRSKKASQVKNSRQKVKASKKDQIGQSSGNLNRVFVNYQAEGEVVASARPCLYQLENSKSVCDLKIIDSHSQQNPAMQKLLPPQIHNQNKDHDHSHLQRIGTTEDQVSKKGAYSEQKSRRKNRKRKRHIGSGSHYNVYTEDLQNLQNIEDNTIDITKRLNRENLEALRDMRLNDRTQKMSSQLQSRLIKDGKRGSPEAFIFSKYCPMAPHNTTQYITHEYDCRLGSLSSSSIGLSMLLSETMIQLSSGSSGSEVQSSINEDDLSIIGNSHGRCINDLDSVSCCNNKNNTQNLLGSSASSSSSKVHQSATTCSITSTRTINFSALEQIGASMEGFVDQDMFEDLMLSDYDTNLSVSPRQNSCNDDGKQNQKGLAVDDFNDIHAPSALLDSDQNQLQQQHEVTQNLHKNQQRETRPASLNINQNAQEFLSRSFDDQEQFELIHLEQSLTSHRLMIEQLEKELQYKSSKIAEYEMINQTIENSASLDVHNRCRTQASCL